MEGIKLCRERVLYHLSWCVIGVRDYVLGSRILGFGLGLLEYMLFLGCLP